MTRQTNNPSTAELICGTIAFVALLAVCHFLSYII